MDSSFKPKPGEEDTFLAIQKGWARGIGDFATALRLDEQRPYIDTLDAPLAAGRRHGV